MFLSEQPLASEWITATSRVTWRLKVAPTLAFKQVDNRQLFISGPSVWPFTECSMPVLSFRRMKVSVRSFSCCCCIVQHVLGLLIHLGRESGGGRSKRTWYANFSRHFLDWRFSVTWACTRSRRHWMHFQLLFSRSLYPSGHWVPSGRVRGTWACLFGCSSKTRFSANVLSFFDRTGPVVRTFRSRTVHAPH